MPRFLFMLLLLQLSLGESLAQVKWTSTTQIISLTNEHFQVFEDTTGNLDLNQLQEREGQLEISNPGYNAHLESAYWLKFGVENESPQQHVALLEFLDPHVSHLEFFNQTGRIVARQGTEFDFHDKQYAHKNHVFELVLPSEETAVFYVRFKANDYHGFSARIHSVSEFVAYSLSEYYLLGVFYGTLLIMSLYNLVIFSYTRNRLRLYYALYVISCSLITFAEDGLGYQYIWGRFPEFNVYLGYLWPTAYMLSLIAYSFSFIGQDGRQHRLHKIALYSAIVFCGWFVLFRMLDMLPRYWISIFIIPIAITYIRVFKYLIQGNRTLRFLIVGSTLVLVGFVIIELRVYGVLQNTIWQVYFFNFSAVLEVILFSMAIGDKIKLDQQIHLRDKELVIQSLRENEELKDKVNRELEVKIESRTRELLDAKLKLEAQSQEITAMNLELDVANRQLKKEVKNAAEKRVLGKQIDPEEFKQVYPDKLSCFQFIEGIKWGEHGYHCRKCDGTSYSTSGSFRSRRCTKCGDIETPTAGTIFHGLRIPIESALYVLALIVHSKGEISSTELSAKSGVGQKACWNFRQRVLEKVGDNPSKISRLDELIFTN